ncbi:hypothetical protein J6590_105143, partial [Homalodisca vitripennis]
TRRKLYISIHEKNCPHVLMSMEQLETRRSHGPYVARSWAMPESRTCQRPRASSEGVDTVRNYRLDVLADLMLQEAGQCQSPERAKGRELLPRELIPCATTDWTFSQTLCCKKLDNARVQNVPEAGDVFRGS